MLWHEFIQRSIAILICVPLLACDARGETDEQLASADSQRQALQTIRHYIELRLDNAGWKEYSKFVAWPDEPGWDCNWVTSGYRLKKHRSKAGKVVVPVVLSRLGLFCYDFEFTPESKLVTINYELAKDQTGWKVSAPIPDYPDISAQVLMKRLRDSAADLHESSERRASFRATAENVSAATGRASTSKR